jgi:transposase InsO family protein
VGEELSERRKRWLVRRRLEGWKVVTLCGHVGVHRGTFYRWWSRFQDAGWKGLERRSRRPRTIHRTAQVVVDRVLELRGRYRWGPCKIEGFLKRRGVRLGHNTVHRILCRAGLNKPFSKPRRMWGTGRFERASPNELWQADFKLAKDDHWILSLLDDHSRFILGVWKGWEPTAEAAVRLLRECFNRYGKPRQVLTDRGAQFYPARGGVSAFTEFLRLNGVEHIVASPRRPSTLGKVEAFHKAYEYEAPMFPSLEGFIHYWNHERPHQGIKYLTPAEAYHKTVDSVTG